MEMVQIWLCYKYLKINLFLQALQRIITVQQLNNPKNPGAVSVYSCLALQHRPDVSAGGKWREVAGKAGSETWGWKLKCVEMCKKKDLKKTHTKKKNPKNRQKKTLSGRNFPFQRICCDKQRNAGMKSKRIIFLLHSGIQRPIVLKDVQCSINNEKCLQ